jgi:hypothetical protein
MVTVVQGMAVRLPVFGLDVVEVSESGEDTSPVTE